MSITSYRNATAERAGGVRWLLWISVAASVFCLLYAHPAHAAKACVGGFCHTVNLFDSMDGKANSASNTWVSNITALITPTFWILATIEFCWAAAVWVYEKDSLNSLTVEIIKKIMFISFFYAVLQHATSWIPTIVESFKTVGNQAAGAPNLTTDYIIANGLAICDMIMGSAPHLNIFNVWGNIPKYIVAAFCCFGILICFVLMAAEYFCALMESYILFATGAVFLAFGSSNWTKDYVQKYLNYAIAVGVRLLVMMLVWALFALLAPSDAFSWDYGPMLEQLGIAILQCMLFLKAPDMTQALLQGGTGLTHSVVTGAAGAITGGVVQAGAMAFGGGAVAGGALKAATSLATGGARGAMSAGHGAAKAATSLAKSGAHGVSSAKKGIHNLGKAYEAAHEIAQMEGKSGTAAVLSGLGKTAGAVAKSLPRSVVNAIKSSSDSDSNQGSAPGPIKRASEALQEKAGTSGRSHAKSTLSLASMSSSSSSSASLSPPGRGGEDAEEEEEVALPQTPERSNSLRSTVSTLSTNSGRVRSTPFQEPVETASRIDP